MLDVPLVAVNHIEAHLYACQLAEGRELFPAVGLVVSGGHTNLYDVRSVVEYELLGTTIDDAAGEAFDKVAAVLGLGYPGGPSIEKAAVGGDPRAFDFPRSFLHEDQLRFSFSGLKTAVLYAANGAPGSHRPVPEMTPQRRADLAASFQAAAVDVLVGKSRQALKQFGYDRLCVGGGVAANSLLRERLATMADEAGIELVVAPMEYCTDNAAMAALGWELLERGRVADLDLDVTPGLVRQRSDREASVAAGRIGSRPCPTSDEAGEPASSVSGPEPNVQAGA